MWTADTCPHRAPVWTRFELLRQKTRKRCIINPIRLNVKPSVWCDAHRRTKHIPPAPPFVRTHINWDEVYKRYGDELTRYEKLIQSFEQEHRMQLTPGAVEIILIPLVEVLESGMKLDQIVVAETLRTLLRDVAEQPDGRDKKAGKRSSWSVIRAYWKNFCNIPPFCGPTVDEE